MKSLFILSVFVLIGTSSYCQKKACKATVVNISKTPNKESVIKGMIFDCGQPLVKLGGADIWVDDKRYPCDTTDHFKINISPGKHQLTARSMGLANIDTTVSIKKGECMTINFYLGYYRDTTSYKQIH